MRSRYRPQLAAIILLLISATMCARAAERPAVAIIIDDLGNSASETQAAVGLPGAVACAFLPRLPYVDHYAREAHRRGKEVILHLPLESTDDRPLGPGGITLDMTRAEIDEHVRADLASVPYVVGVNNHMGSLMTQHPGDMAWLMDILHGIGGLFFVDSRTTTRTVAFDAARNAGLPATWRDVFLDDVQNRAAVAAQFARLIAIARDKGTALAIGHPHPVTLSVLREKIPELAAQGISLVSVSELIRLQGEVPKRQWPPSSFRSQLAAKSSNRSASSTCCAGVRPR